MIRSCHLASATKENDAKLVNENVSHESMLFTDESRLYRETGKEFATHRTVKPSAKEYVRREGDVVVHSNTSEGVFSVFKRGMIGVYQHCGEAHLSSSSCHQANSPAWDDWNCSMAQTPLR